MIPRPIWSNKVGPASGVDGTTAAVNVTRCAVAGGGAGGAVDGAQITALAVATATPLATPAVNEIVT
jgi:hypothetical protein